MSTRGFGALVLRSALLALALGAAGCKPEAPPPPPQTPVSPPVAVATPRTGSEIFHACQLCHSTREMQRGPILEGLPAWYVELQLRKFRDGIRGRNAENKSETLMGAGESILHDDGEIRAVAAHIAAQPPQKHLLVVRGDAERGKKLYTGCVPCHGEKGEGRPEVKGPPLNTTEDWYQLDQLKKFKHGFRATNIKDAEGMAMRAATVAVPEEDFKDIVRYVCEVLGNPAGKPPATPPAR